MANINESDNSKFIKKIPSLAKRGRGDLAEEKTEKLGYLDQFRNAKK